MLTEHSDAIQLEHSYSRVLGVGTVVLQSGFAFLGTP